MSNLATPQISSVTSLVEGKLNKVTSWASQAKSIAQTAIDAVGSFTTPTFTLNFPGAPTIEAPTEPGLSTIPSPAVTNSPQSVTFQTTSGVSLVTPPTLPAPQYGTPQAPEARPSAQLPVAPTNYEQQAVPVLPATPTFTTEAAPTLALPDEPELLTIDVPEFSFPTISAFSGTAPEYTPPAAVDVPQMSLPTPPVVAINASVYETERRNAFLKEIDAAVSAVDRETLAATDTAMTKFAAQNFSLPPGMLLGAVNNIEEGASRKIRDAMSKINKANTDAALEDFKALVGYYMEIERIYIDTHLEMVRQMVETEKLRVRAQIELFNAAVARFNAQQNVRETYASTYKAQLDAALRVNSAKRVVVEGAVAETAENESRVQIYNAKIQLRRAAVEVYKTNVQANSAPVEAYKSQLIGVKAQADTVVANIEAYREAIRAYAASVSAASSEIEAYAAEVQATASGAQVQEANVRTYTQFIQEAARQTGVYKTFADAQFDVLQANLRTFQEAASANESFVRAQAAKFTGQAQVADARLNAFSTSVRTHASYNKALAQYNAAILSYNLVSAENTARAESLARQAQAETDKINAGALAAKAQALAGLAQGAMSAMHVSASAQGSGSVSASTSEGFNFTKSQSGATSRTESRRQVVSA